MKNLIKYYWEFHWVTMIAIGWSIEKTKDGYLSVLDIYILCFKISIFY